MGIEEVALLVALQQLAMAGKAYLAKISPLPVNVWAKAAVLVGQQIAANVATGAVLGLAAAKAEFATTQTQEAGVVAGLSALPPIT